jgi:beta-fructofuranosidase
VSDQSTPAGRPAVHFTADRGWINDPLSPLWDGSRYHLWFQYVPDRTEWAPSCHWGHAVSDDLLHWREGDLALAPGDGDDGVWSGSVVPTGEGLRAFYTSVDAEAPSLGRVRWADAATADGPWVKAETTIAPPDGLGVTAFRDPFVARTGDAHRMLVGAQLAGETAAALSFTSTDLTHWEFDGVAASRSVRRTGPVWTGSLWECPQLLEIGSQEVFVASVWHDGRLHHVVASVIDRDGATLTARSWQQVTVGPGYYAPAAFVDADGRPCLVFWIRGLVDHDAGRAGALSVPHRVVLDDAGRIVLRLHPAVTAAARRDRHGSNAAVLEPEDLGREPVELVADGRVRVRISHQDGVVVVEAEDQPVRIAAASANGVQVLVDGPVVEVLTSGGSFAHVMSDPVTWDDRARGATLAWLR